MTAENKEFGSVPPLPAPQGEEIGGKEIEEKIKKLKEEIEENTDIIAKVNSDNLIEINIDDYETTDFARKLIKEYDIRLYVSLACDFEEQDSEAKEIISILQSNTIDEFIKNLENYADAVEKWKEIEEERFDEKVLSRHIVEEADINKAKFIVKVYHFFPCSGLEQLEKVICSDSKKEAEKIADYVWYRHKALGIPGKDILTKIEKVKADTKKSIIKEYKEYFLQYWRNNDNIDDLIITTARSVKEDALENDP